MNLLTAPAGAGMGSTLIMISMLLWVTLITVLMQILKVLLKMIGPILQPLKASFLKQQAILKISATI